MTESNFVHQAWKSARKLFASRAAKTIGPQLLVAATMLFAPRTANAGTITDLNTGCGSQFVQSEPAGTPSIIVINSNCTDTNMNYGVGTNIAETFGQWSAYITSDATYAITDSSFSCGLTSLDDGCSAGITMPVTKNGYYLYSITMDFGDFDPNASGFVSVGFDPVGYGRYTIISESLDGAKVVALPEEFYSSFYTTSPFPTYLNTIVPNSSVTLSVLLDIDANSLLSGH